ncbi:DUF4263 domain-containing protein [Pontibacter sp. KCTC 32443]|uniref:Shedu anti-phage system protein SduA domain-containing protein n=1 Tax=Pontibacter TaxID=323449 RepID=UPI00164E274D|nr:MULTISPECIES: Shedu anti-phage system protein SduA domain-containing protein [Pontibacter]MBC5772788.1 DUF4263 domain-containing protein [Pontibacter sp. KCTC 32443]
MEDFFNLDDFKFSDYFKKTKNRLTKILEEQKGSDSKDEKALQKFFEKHPTSILGCLGEVNASERIFGNCIITQPAIKYFYGDRKPDFLIVTWDSLNLYFNFIEIEDASKKIFSPSNNISFTQEFNQALGQLKQWDTTLGSSPIEYCRELLDSLFFDNFKNTPDKELHINFILVYGFSDEVKSKGKGANSFLQGSFKEKNMFHCTYSRLLEGFKGEPGMFTVKMDYTARKFKAVGLSPFSEYGPDEWSDFHNIILKDEAIMAHSSMDEEQKKKEIKEIEKMDKLDKYAVRKIMDERPGLSI